MASQGSFTRCMVNLQAGDSVAQAAIVERFVSRLIPLVRSRMQPNLRSKLDPEDAVQSAFGSFFDGYADGKYYFNDWDSLWSLLARIAVRKYNRKAERLNAAKRSVDREDAWSLASLQELIDRDPTPEEAAVCSDLLQTILASSPKPLHKEIIILKLQHYTNQEISQQLGRTERTVYRVLDRIRRLLQDLEQENVA